MFRCGELLTPVGPLKVAAPVCRLDGESAAAGQLRGREEGVVVFEFDERVAAARAEFRETRDAVAEEVMPGTEVRVVADAEGDGRRNLLVDLGDDDAAGSASTASTPLVITVDVPLKPSLSTPSAFRAAGTTFSGVTRIGTPTRRRRSTRRQLRDFRAYTRRRRPATAFERARGFARPPSPAPIPRPSGSPGNSSR